jgi:hypothetical protein
MVTKTQDNKQVSQKKGLSYSEKFGLDKDRKKLGIITNDKIPVPTLSLGENFSITRIVITDSKKRYDYVNPETEQISHGKIKIAQFDGILEDGKAYKVYSPNSAIVEACENIMNDADYGINKDGFLTTPALIDRVIEGTGEKSRKYIAFA